MFLDRNRRDLSSVENRRERAKKWQKRLEKDFMHAAELVRNHASAFQDKMDFLDKQEALLQEQITRDFTEARQEIQKQTKNLMKRLRDQESELDHLNVELRRRIREDEDPVCGDIKWKYWNGETVQFFFGTVPDRFVYVNDPENNSFMNSCIED